MRLKGFSIVFISFRIFLLSAVMSPAHPHLLQPLSVSLAALPSRAFLPFLANPQLFPQSFLSPVVMQNSHFILCLQN